MHLIYLIHEINNLIWITEINELFHDILIYWDAPVCGKWILMYCTRLLASGICPFIAVVLNSSPHVPLLCTFCTFLLSLQTFVLFDCKCPTKWTSHHRIFRNDSSSNRTYMFHSKGIEVRETWIYLYLFTEVYYVTLHASLVSFVCVCENPAQLKYMNECSKVK